MHWNLYAGMTGGVGGNAICDGAILLQCEHLALVAWISLVMPGQKINDSAFDIMVDMLWWIA